MSHRAHAAVAATGHRPGRDRRQSRRSVNRSPYSSISPTSSPGTPGFRTRWPLPRGNRTAIRSACRPPDESGSRTISPHGSKACRRNLPRGTLGDPSPHPHRCTCHPNGFDRSNTNAASCRQTLGWFQNPDTTPSTGRRRGSSGASRCLPGRTGGDDSKVAGMGPSRQKETAGDDWRTAHFGQKRQPGYFSGIIFGN